MTDILMPALSPTMEEGTLAKWHIKPGDTISSGDVIAEIETDKATMEVEAVDEGEVAEILAAEGAVLKVNTPIARLKGESGSSASPPPQPSAPARDNASDQKQGGGHGSPEGAATPQGVQPAAQAIPPKANGAGTSASQAGGQGKRVFASPLARRLAERAGIDLSAVQGSGPHGRIIKRDVEGTPTKAPAAQAAQPQARSAAEPRQVLSLEQMGIKPGSYDLIPLDNIRKISARRLTDSFRDIPHFPLTIDCEIDRLLDARKAVNAALESEGVKVSVNDIVIKAAAVALKRVPEANASFTPEGIALHHHADISMAVAIEGGLITPIIFEAETKGLAQIARETKDLAARARARKLKPQEFQGGTFSVSNLGMFGVKDFASIINEPQGAIMSVGAGEQRPVVKNGALAVATVMSVTLTCDHRVVDGATGARFLQAFKTLAEDPVTMLA